MNQVMVSTAEPSEKILEPLSEEFSFSTRYLRFRQFELDLHRQRLDCEGVSVLLQGKLFKALVMLLQHSGQVVTRKMLLDHLWPEGDGVDLDSNLNTTMNKLRRILRDTAAVHPLIQTIARRDYLFTGQVEPVERAISEAPKPEVVDQTSLRLRWTQAVGVFCAERSNTCLKASLIVLTIASILFGAAITLYAHQQIYHL